MYKAVLLAVYSLSITLHFTAFS